MKQKSFVFGLIFLGFLVIFLARESWINSHTTWRLLGEEEVLLIQEPQGRIVGLGNPSAPAQEALRSSIQGYFSAKQILWPAHESPLKRWELGHGYVIALSRNLMLGKIQDQRFLFLDNPSEKDLQTLLETGLSTESHWWILADARFPESLPPPKEMILLLARQKPSSRLKQLAQTHQIPLLSVAETGGFSLEEQGGHWTLKTRK